MKTHDSLNWTELIVVKLTGWSSATTSPTGMAAYYSGAHLKIHTPRLPVQNSSNLVYFESTEHFAAWCSISLLP